MGNTGTSGEFSFTDEDLNEIKYHKIEKFSIDGMPSPPIINNTNTISIAMTKWVTPWPEISFERICYPRWDGVTQYQGDISNKPDFIKDYHFISLMRNVDTYLNPIYQGFIEQDGDTPEPEYPRRGKH